MQFYRRKVKEVFDYFIPEKYTDNFHNEETQKIINKINIFISFIQQNAICDRDKENQKWKSET